MTSNARRSVGIDLGTSFSSLTCLDADLKPQPVANAEGDFKTPSVVYFQENGGAIVGRDAIEPGFSRPERFVANSKRFLGEPDVRWEIDGVIYTPVDIAALVIRKLLEDAEPQVGLIEEAVITVPAHFTSYQRQLTVEAGRQAGLTKVAIVNEPVAAALSYALGEEGIVMSYLGQEYTILIYDLGGGTFDLSIVRYDRKQLRVLAASGERFLGGIDWDQCLLDRLADTALSTHGIDFRADPQSLRRLAHKVEIAKRALSNPKIETATVLFEHGGAPLEFSVDRRDFEQLTGHLVARTRVLTEHLLESLEDEDMTWQHVDCIIPVGGCTRMPMIRTLLESLVEDGTAIRYLSPDLAIAQGAALFAGILTSRNGERIVAGASPMADVLANYSTRTVNANHLGVIVRHGDRRINHVLIPKNTPLPASVNVVVGTFRPNQSRIKVRVVEGNSRSLGAGRSVCTCIVDHLPPNLPANSLFDVSLTYDVDGLLQVMATHRDSGRVATASTLYAADEEDRPGSFGDPEGKFS